MVSIKKACVIALALMVSTPAVVIAKDHGKKHHHSDDYDNEDGGVHINISFTDQAVIKDYLGKKPRRHCPPGLAKKHNGCLPPGIAKKYNIGQPLPEGVVYAPLPYEIVSHLHPRAGYRYVQVDQDVLLISEASKKVIDAITLLSAVK